MKYFELSEFDSPYMVGSGKAMDNDPNKPVNVTLVYG